MKVSKIAVIGTGYVGLSTGVGLAELGHNVICIDNNQEKIELLQSGISPISEAGMTEAIARSAEADRIRFTVDITSVVKECEVIFLCLPTPQGSDGSADLSYVKDVSLTIGSHLRRNSVVDGRNILDKANWIDAGFEYRGIGR